MRVHGRPGQHGQRVGGLEVWWQARRAFQFLDSSRDRDEIPVAGEGGIAGQCVREALQLLPHPKRIHRPRTTL